MLKSPVTVAALLALVSTAGCGGQSSDQADADPVETCDMARDSLEYLYGQFVGQYAYDHDEVEHATVVLSSYLAQHTGNGSVPDQWWGVEPLVVGERLRVACVNAGERTPQPVTNIETAPNPTTPATAQPPSPTDSPSPTAPPATNSPPPTAPPTTDPPALTAPPATSPFPPEILDANTVAGFEGSGTVDNPFSASWGMGFFGANVQPFISWDWKPDGSPFGCLNLDIGTFDRPFDMSWFAERVVFHTPDGTPLSPLPVGGDPIENEYVFTDMRTVTTIEANAGGRFGMCFDGEFPPGRYTIAVDNTHFAAFRPG